MRIPTSIYKTLGLLVLPCFLFAGEVVISDFGGGLNTKDLSATLPDNASPDLLNVNLDPGGKSVKKRQGYGLYKNLPINTSTTAVHGGYHFQDTTGNNIQLWANAEEIASIIAGATPTKVSSITAYATMQCTDSQGSAYCFTTSRNTPVKTDGTSGGTSYQGSIPNGTMATFTPIRLAVAGVSGSINTIYFSKANTFTDFTTGITDPDPFTEVIASPGSRLTHIRYACGKVLWWKDQSFGWLAGDTQSDITIQIVQNDVGTLDNSSAYYNNTVWFRGQDNHIYQYDCANLTRLSRVITPTVEGASRRISNSWTQSSQTDFGAGAVLSSSPTVTLSTSTIAGSVIPSSRIVSDTSNNDFSLGSYTSSIDTSTVSGGITFKTFLNDDFSTFSNWTNESNTYTDDTMTAINGIADCTNGAGKECAAVSTQTITSDLIVQYTMSGANLNQGMMAITNVSRQGYTVDATLNSSTVRFWKTSDFNALFGGASWTLICSSGVSTTSSGDIFTLSRNASSNLLSFYKNGTTLCTATDSTYTAFTQLRLFVARAGASAGGIDNVYDTSRKAAFTGRLFDTLYSTPTYGTFTAGNTSTGTYAYAFRCSSATLGGYTTDTAISSGDTITGCAHKRFIVYSATMTAPGNSATVLPQISSANIVSVSTGSYRSAVNNAPNVTQWDNFTVDETLNDGTLSYFVRSSTGIFGVLDVTPTWTAQTKNATVAVSTGIYFQARADFGITVATQTPSLNGFTFEWFEGSAADKAYIEYFDDHVWVSVSSGTGGTNNRIQRWDLINQAWLLDDIAANGLIVDQARLYIGDPVQGRVFRFGDVSTDNGSNFQAYWKSKDFTGSDPFVQNEFTSYDWMLAVSTGSLTTTYQVNASTSASYSLNLYDATARLIRRSNNMPPGKIGTFYNVKVGNTTDQPWEAFGHRARYTPLNWKPQ